MRGTAPMTIQQPTTKQGAKGCMMGANDCLLTHLSDDGCVFFSLFLWCISRREVFLCSNLYCSPIPAESMCI